MYQSSRLVVEQSSHQHRVTAELGVGGGPIRPRCVLSRKK